MPEGIQRDRIIKIAHELANSLNGISNAVQLIATNSQDQQKLPKELMLELLTNLKDECSRMEIQINELRQLATQSQP